MPFKFYIQDLYDRTEVVEPRDWKDIISVLKRDFNVHGVFFQYTDGSLKLGFSCSGKELLEAAYQADGADAYYLFEVEEAVDEHSAYSVIFSGEMDFSTRNYNEDMFEIEVNEINNLIRLKNRSGLKINLNKGISLDGGILGNMNYDDSIISLATKEFKQLIVLNGGETLDSIQSDAVTTQTFLFGNIGFLTTESDELRKYSSINSELSADQQTGAFFIAEDEGALEIAFDIDVDINMTEDQGSGTTVYTATLLLVYSKPVKGNIGTLLSSETIDTDVDSAASPNNNTLTLAKTDSVYAIVTPGTELSLELTIEMTTTGTAQMSGVLDITKFDFTITDKIGLAGTQSQWLHVHDALNKNLNFIVNDYNYLYSELLGGDLQGYLTDGCFSQMFITNGYRIRQIDDDSKTIQFTFKDFIENINTIGAVGYGIEELESPKELGVHDLYWVEITGGVAEARIMGANLIYDIYVGNNIGFFNSVEIYGFYELTEVTYNPAYTTIKFDVTKNPNYYGTLFGDNPEEATTYPDVFMVTDESTEVKERLRVEKWEHFYSDSELIDLGIVQEFSEEPFDDALYNELGIKFNKYSNDEDKPTTLEEIHTDSGWVLPVVKFDKKLDLAMSWIGSTFLFNDVRDKIFSKKPTTSNSLDNDLFFCEKAEKEGVYTVDFFVSNDKIRMPADAYENVINGSSFFNVSGANNPLNDGQYQIDTSFDVVFLISINQYDVPVVSVGIQDLTDTVTITHQHVFQKFFKPESNDKVSTTGITRPTYVMNQRRTIKRFLIRWGSYINSVLAYLSSGTIRNLFFLNNGAFTSDIIDYELDTECLMGDNTYMPLVEDENVNIDTLTQAKFKPNLISGTTHICDEDFNRIKDAHKNKLAVAGVQFDGSLYGTIPDTDEFKVTKYGFEMLFDTGDYTNIGGAAAFVFALGGSFTAKEGIHIQFYEPNNALRVFYGSDFNTPAAIDYVFEHNTKYRIRFESIGGSQERAWVNNEEVNTIGGVGTVNWGTNASIFGTGSQSGGIGYPSQWFNGILYEFEYYQINSSYEKISSLIKLDIANGTSSEIPNIATDAPASTELSMSAAPDYLTGLSERNYGYITMTSPNGKTVLGWLMDMKRNPVDRITKIKLLEKA